VATPAGSLEGFERPPPSFTFCGDHPRLGECLSVYNYRDDVGILFWVCRYAVDPDPTIGQAAGSIFRSWVYSEGQARLKSPPPPRPLYHLDEIQVQRERPIYIVGDERSAEALKKVGNGHDLVTTTAFGRDFKAVRWTDIAGRSVICWPDNDDQGIEAMGHAVAALLPLKCAVSIVSVPRETKPGHWNVAEAIETGWTWPQIDELIADHMVIAQNYAAKVVPLRKTPKVTVDAKPKPADEPAKAAWRQWGLDCKHNGTPHCNTENVCRALAHIKQSGGSFGNLWYDEFAQRIYTDTVNGPRSWEEADTIALQCFLQAAAEMKIVQKHTVYDAVVRQARRCTRNPVKEWLESLTWDKTERLGHMLCDGWGAPYNEYTAAVGRCFLTGAVARIYEPGCQLDYTPVFEGLEGIHKSTALRLLFGSWHCEPKYKINDRDFYVAMASKWCLELSEMAQLEGVSHKMQRACLTCPDDHFRAPYERNASDHPRMCVFAATVNGDDWHNDPHGARRWWPIRCTAIDMDWIRCHREQLFAEALHRYQDGQSWWDVPTEPAKQEQDERRRWDVWHPGIERYTAARDFVRVEDILRDVCDIPTHQWDWRAQNRITDTLKAMGWTKSRRRERNEVVRGWRRAPVDPIAHAQGTDSTPDL
jgi:putative DNA primase/helicase